MKSLYIIPFLLLSATFYAQEKKSSELQDQEQVLKDAKESEKKMQQRNETKSLKKEKQNVLASEQGFEIKQEPQKTEMQNSNSGKPLPNTASFEEILATIPNRQNSLKASAISNSITKVQGIPGTSTLEEIKKTIPKN